MPKYCWVSAKENITMTKDKQLKNEIYKERLEMRKKIFILFLILIPINVFALTKAPIDITKETVASLSKSLDEEIITSEELINIYLERIKKYNDQYNALITINENAINEAKDFGKDIIPAMLKDKKTLLSGNSGVGKSTFINHILPGANLRTSEISDAHNTGMHTTTFSEMLELPEGGYLIDTPGIKGFGTFDMEPEELTSYFKDIFHFSKDCRFNNCTHTHEPGCAVLKAVEEHYIAASRYQSYLSMLEDKDENKYREAY